MLDGVDEGIATERSTMGLAVGLVRRTVGLQGTLTHYTLTDDEGRLALYLLCLVESLANLVNVVAVDFEYLPAKSTILCSCVLVHDILGLSRELDIVAVVEHDEVVQAEHRGDAGCTLRDFFLNATIRDVGIDSLLVEGGVAGMSGKELGCYGSTYSEDMTLSERTRCVFNAACNLKFRVTCSR